MTETLINPILPGFNPDPSVCRVGDDYYLAVSSFEWYPGIPIYHSKDLKNWRLLTYCLKDEKVLDIRNLSASRGIWAPCLSYCEVDSLFYLAYTIVYSTNAGLFDVDNFLITASNIEGPWSEPIYIHSSGFDPSVFHDDDGKKYIVALEWETRENHYMPGEACIVEYDPKNKKLIGEVKRIYRGGTVRGWIEGPHLYKHKDYYYILTAEGGTYYNHCAAIGRSKNIYGPYTPYPMNPIITSKASVPENTWECWNNHPDPAPGVELQRAGHSSLVETPAGEVFAFYHCGRPFMPETRCTLGRETCIQKMEWTEDDWIRMVDGGNLARVEVEGSSLSEVTWDPIAYRDDFEDKNLGIRYISPRINYNSYIDLQVREGYLRVRGQENLSSTNRMSLIAHKLTSFHATLKTKMDFTPHRYMQSAGVCIFYDEYNYLLFRKTYNEEANQSSLELLMVDCGDKSELLKKPVLVNDSEIYLKIEVNERATTFSWSYADANYQQIGGEYDTSKYSDDYGDCGDNTGAVLGIFCVDAYRHEHYADFDFFEYKNNTERT